MVGVDATGGGGTRVYMRGHQFSFPLKLLLLMNAGFFCVLSAGIPPPLISPGEALSTREKVLVKVNVVDTDDGRWDECRAPPLLLLLLVHRGDGDGGPPQSKSPTLLAPEKALIFDLRRCGRSGILYVDTGTGCAAHE
jgi:hypothetical protein